MPARQRHAGTVAGETVLSGELAARRPGVLERPRCNCSRPGNAHSRQRSPYDGGNRSSFRSDSAHQGGGKRNHCSQAGRVAQQFCNAGPVESQPLQSDDHWNPTNRVSVESAEGRINGNTLDTNMLIVWRGQRTFPHFRSVDGGKKHRDLLVRQPGVLRNVSNSTSFLGVTPISSLHSRRAASNSDSPGSTRPATNSTRSPTPLARCAASRNWRISTISSRAKSIGITTATLPAINTSRSCTSGTSPCFKVTL